VGLDSGKLRHVVDIEERVDEQDEDAGGVTTTWQPVFTNVRAAIEPLSAREFIASHAEQAQVVARITIRHRPGLNATQRIVHGTKCCSYFVGQEIYNPAGFLRDKDSGLEYVTIPCSQGANEG
jgi:SPP1 family predicted phage head-tail adaptor